MTTSTNKKAKGAFVINVTGNQTINGELAIDVSAVMGDTKKSGVIKFNFTNFKSEGDCTVTFEGGAKTESTYK